LESRESDALDQRHIVLEIINSAFDCASNFCCFLMFIIQNFSQLEGLHVPLVDILLHVLIGVGHQSIFDVLIADVVLNHVRDIDQFFERLEISFDSLQVREFCKLFLIEQSLTDVKLLDSLLCIFECLIQDVCLLDIFLDFFKAVVRNDILILVVVFLEVFDKLDLLLLKTLFEESFLGFNSLSTHCNRHFNIDGPCFLLNTVLNVLVLIEIEELI
jgi:hypothetical protein